MPKGVPKAGKRDMSRTHAKRAAFRSSYAIKSLPRVTFSQPIPKDRDQTHETDDQIYARLRERFRVLEEITTACIKGTSRAEIVSGPPGLGKSYCIEKALESYDASGEKYTIIKGYARATGIVRKLFRHKDAKNIVVFDDCDSIFGDEVSLNILKTVCDTTEKRVVSWLSEGKLQDDHGEDIPETFEFKGSVIFVTNIDFDEEIARGSKMSQHYLALISRAHYIDCALHTKRDYILRIKQVTRDNGLLRKAGLSEPEIRMVLDYIEDNQDRMRELSLRSAIKIAALVLANPQSWTRLANVTCLRSV